jgi:serine protease Do
MKNIFLAVVTLCSTTFVVAQSSTVEEIVIDTVPSSEVREVPIKNQKTVTIRMRGDKWKGEKMTVEIEGNKIKINGKDAGELKDVDVSIGENRFLFNKGGTILMPPMDKGRILELRDRVKDLNINRNAFQGKTWAMKSKALLGIGMEKVDNGVKINDVSKESGAEKAGLKEGDIITKINDKEIKTEMDITNIVGANKPGTIINIEYVREGKKQSTKATLGERKDTYTFNNTFSTTPMEGMIMPEMPSMPPMENFDFKFDGQMPDMQVFKMAPGQGNEFFQFNNTPKLGASLMETEDDKGLEITNVEENSAAAKAGLQKGDIITKVGDKAVKSVMDIKNAVKENKDKAFAVNYLRNGKEQKTEIKFPKKLKEVSL